MTIKAYSKAKDGNKSLSKNFKVREFACMDGSDPIFVDSDLVDILQKIRNHFGQPVTISSAYRTPGRNRAIGGTTYSQHLYGMAADIRVKNVSPDKVATFANNLMPKKGGIGTYQNFVHVDVRTTRARWNG